MAKGPDGVWSLTIGPVEPELYAYSFLVDGLRVKLAWGTSGKLASYEKGVHHNDIPHGPANPQ